MEAWTITREARVSDISLARQLSTDENILCVRGLRKVKIDKVRRSNSSGVVSSKLAKIPRSVESVTTVVLILQQPIPIAYYTDSSTHYQWCFDVTVIDWKTRCVIGHQTFEGGIPDTPARKHSHLFGGDWYGGQPWDSVRMWLYGEQ